MAVGILVERTVPATAFWSMMAIAQQGWPLLQLPYQRTDTARNRMARMLLESEYTHLCMLDIDHKHPPDVVHRLARWAGNDSHRLVIGALYFRRNEPHDPLAMVKKDDGYYYGLADWNGSGLMRVDILGTGAILISRKVFEILPGPWFQYEYDGWAQDGWPTEDVYFCKLCRKHDINVWLDTSTQTVHLSELEVTEQTYRDYVKAHPEFMEV